VKDLSALQVATLDACIANYILQHTVIFELVTPMLQIALAVVNYGICKKQSAPTSRLIAMARFYDLNLSVKTKEQVKHMYRFTEIFATAKNLRDL